MTLYVETSALLSWLLAEAAGGAALQAIRAGSDVVTSDLTFVECRRALHRGVSNGRWRRDVARDAADRLRVETSTWIRHGMTPSVLRHACEPFPREPIRALDALHLATAIAMRQIRPDLVILSFDDRVVENAQALGFRTISRPRLVRRNGL